MFKLENSLITFLLILISVSCSTTESVTETTGAEDSIFPEWYQEEGFVADSLHFSSFATAISSDSSISIKRAEEQARHNLESRIAERMEAVRLKLEDDGFSHAKNADFILTLRNAHAPVETEAEFIKGAATKTDNKYRGFAQVSIKNSALKDLIEAGFEGKASYWTEISKTDSLLAY